VRVRKNAARRISAGVTSRAIGVPAGRRFGEEHRSKIRYLLET
jgi:hypothetical protein